MNTKRILIIKPSSFGDIVHGLQVADSIRYQFESQGTKVYIDWVVRDIFADLLRQSPVVDRCLIFRRKDGFWPFIKLIRQIREIVYDYILDMQGLARSAILTFSARSKNKIGRVDSREGAFLAYHKKTTLPLADKGSHAVEILKKFLPALNLSEELHWPLHFRETEWIYPFQPNSYCLLFPNSRRPEKEWPYFSKLTQALIENSPYNIVWAGNDVKDKNSFPEDRFYNLVGKTRLNELPNLIRRAKCIVSNDSGPMHLAAALQQKVVALFGPTEVNCFGPYPLNSDLFCVLKGQGNIIENISLDSVLKTVLRLIDKA